MANAAKLLRESLDSNSRYENAINDDEKYMDALEDAVAPGSLSDDSRRTQKYAPTGVVFQISIPQAHILYIEYRRMF